MQPIIGRRYTKIKVTFENKINGRDMSVNQKSKIPGYYEKVWFSSRYITNIVTLKNLTEKYRATYNSNDHIFIVHK